MEILTQDHADALPNNLFGTLGPRCPRCSGLGRTLGLGSPGAPTRYASRCFCGGTGVDIEAIRAAEMSSLLKHMAMMEKKILALEMKRSLHSKSKRSQGKLSRQYWMELIAWATASGVAVANTTNETILFPNITIPANYMNDSRNLRIMATGQHSTLGSGVVTVLFTLRWNGVAGTIICKTAAITQLVGLTAAYWELSVKIEARVNGASGAILGNGYARVFGATAPTIGSATGAPAVAPMTNGGQVTPANATSLDLTADTPLSLTITHGAANASNTATGLQYTVESMN